MMLMALVPSVITSRWQQYIVLGAWVNQRVRGNSQDTAPRRHLRLSSKCMDRSTVNVARTRVTRRLAKTVDATEIAARNVV